MSASSTLLFAETLLPNDAPDSIHEIRFSRPCQIESFRVVCEGEQPHPEISFVGQTPPAPFTIELFGCLHANKKRACARLCEPHERQPATVPSSPIALRAGGKHHAVDYIVIRVPSIVLSLCLYGVEVEGSASANSAPWQLLPAFHHLDGILAGQYDPVQPEDPASIEAIDDIAPKELTALARSPALTPASSPAPPSAATLQELCRRLTNSRAGERALMDALDDLKRLSPWLTLCSSEQQAKSLACAVLTVLGSRDRLAAHGLPLIDAALDALKVLATVDAATEAALEAGALPILLGWLFAGVSASPLRCRVLDTIIELAHQPAVMTQLTETVEPVALDGSPVAAHAASSRGDGQQGKAMTAYKRLLRLVLDPVPPMMLARLKRMFALVRVWEATQLLKRASTKALDSDAADTKACDAICAPLLRAWHDLLLAVHTLTRMPTTETSDAEGPARVQPLAVSEARLVCGTGFWTAVLSTLSAKTVHASSLCSSTVGAATELVDIVVETLGGALCLTAEPRVVTSLLSLLERGDGAVGNGSWASVLSTQLRRAVQGVHAMNRLVNGGMGALHSLLAMEVSPLVLGSPAGLGALAACLQPALLADEHGAVVARHASSLLVRVVSSPFGVVTDEYASCLYRDTVTAQKTSRDAALLKQLGVLQLWLQPVDYLREHGGVALSCALSTLLKTGSRIALSTTSTAEGGVSGLSPDAVAAGGESFALALEQNVASNCDTLTSALRALRRVTVSASAAVALHEANCLDWLHVILCVGSRLLCKWPGQHAVIWLLEAAVGTTQSVLSHLVRVGVKDCMAAQIAEALLGLGCSLVCCSPTASFARSDELSVPQPPSGSLSEAIASLEAALLSALTLLWEGPSSTDLQEAITKDAADGIGHLVGVASLLSRCMPPPLPVALERLPHASCVLSVPTAGPWRAPRALSRAMSAWPAAELPLEVDTLQQKLFVGLEERRNAWKKMLQELNPSALRLFFARLFPCSARAAFDATASLIVRVVGLLGDTVNELVIEPLYALLIEASAREPSPNSQGEPLAPSGRVAFLLVAVASNPSGRAAMLSTDPTLLGKALSAVLKPNIVAVRRAGLRLLRVLCTEGVAPSAGSADGRPGELPSVAALGPALVALAAAEAEADACCRDEMRLVRDWLLSVFAKSDALQHLGRALAATDPLAALRVMEANCFAGSTPAAVAAGVPDVPSACPAAWRHDERFFPLALEDLSTSLFGQGLVSTELNGARADDAEPNAKRPRKEDAEADEFAGLTSAGSGPVHPRGKPKHADEYNALPTMLGMVGKRSQNSSRAPSKHVDAYQPAPIVRKTVSTDGPKLNDALDGSAGGMACGQGMNMQLMQQQQQQLGLAVAQQQAAVGMCGNGGPMCDGMQLMQQQQFGGGGMCGGMGMAPGQMMGATPMWPMGGMAMAGQMMGCGGGPADVPQRMPHAGGGFLTQQKLQLLLEDPEKMEQFLADNPSMTGEVTRLMEAMQ